MPLPIVYCARNKVTGDCYVGATVGHLAHRAYDHRKASRDGKRGKLADAQRQFGEDAFEWSVLFYCRTRAEALAAEAVVVARCKPAYNTLPGGVIGNPKGTRYPRTEEHNRKISEGQKGRVQSAETRAKISAARRAKKG